MRIALTRRVSASLGQCELTHLDRQRIDIEWARAQHGQYEKALAALGCQIVRLPEEPDLPDAVFVEDAAVVLDELAIIARPGAASRRPEIWSVVRALRRYRHLVTIESPGTLDGGDVLCVGRTLYVGLSRRRNRDAIERLRAVLASYGYHVQGVPVQGCLHLKSAVTQVAESVLLINAAWVDAAAFGGLDLVLVDLSEPYAANALLIDGTVLYAAAYPRTRKRLEERGIGVHTVDVSELAKAEGAVTCCSLVFSDCGGIGPIGQRHPVYPTDPVDPE